MSTVPDPYTWLDKEIPDFRDMKSRIDDVLTWLNNPPMIRLRKTTAQSIPNTTTTAVIWDYVEVETENMWDATAPTRIKPQTPGWYVGNAGYSFSANTSGYREMSVLKNGVTTCAVIRTKNKAYADSGETVVSRGNLFLEQFNGTTDYIEQHVWQNSGGALSVISDVVERQPDFSLTWVAPL